MVVSLKKIIKAANFDKDSVEAVLSTFNAVNSTSKEEVENFLRKNAYRMELDGQSATYLIINDEAQEKGYRVIDGYFTIAIKTLHFDDKISNNKRRKMTGKTDDFVPAYLIGQLAKSDSAPKGAGKSYLDIAISYIKTAAQIVGGRLIYLDCDDNLVGYYERNQFTFLQKDEEKGLNQMYLVI